MAPYDDYRLSSSILESPRDGPRHSRERLHSRGPPVRERPRPAFDYDERFESRLHAADRYGPPARRPDRYYDDADSFVSSERPERRRGVSPPPRPRLLRRQSSLDTFDRIPSRKLEEMYYRGPSPDFHRLRDRDTLLRGPMEMTSITRIFASQSRTTMETKSSEDSVSGTGIQLALVAPVAVSVRGLSKNALRDPTPERAKLACPRSWSILGPSSTRAILLKKRKKRS